MKDMSLVVVGDKVLGLKTTVLEEMKEAAHRNIDSIHNRPQHHHHHPKGVVYRSYCLNSGTVAVSTTTSRMWWCIESLFPAHDVAAITASRSLQSLVLGSGVRTAAQRWVKQSCSKGNR